MATYSLPSLLPLSDWSILPHLPLRALLSNMELDSRLWLSVCPFLPPSDRVSLSRSSSSLHSTLRPTLTPQFDLQLQYLRWRKSVLASPKRRSDVLVEDKSWFPQLLFDLEYDPIDSDEPGKSLFRSQCGDVLVVPKPVISEVAETQESDYSHLSEAEFGADQVDFRSQSDLLKRQKALLERVQQRKAAESANRKQQLLTNYKGNCLWGVILCHGGYFAVGVYDRTGKCLFHQSDHRYVSRKKQGGRQVAKDKHAGSSIHSAGSSMRREMEKKHQEAIFEIVTLHKKELGQCDIIFLHAPGINRSFFVADGAPLKDLEAKIRSVGLTAGKANFTEITRIIQELSTVELRLLV